MGHLDFIKTLKQYLDETLSKTTSNNWLKYSQQTSSMQNATSWMIFSDYCIGNKHIDSISFVICPTVNINYLISSEINSFIPKDIKKTRAINKRTLNYLKFPYYFSINFAIDDIESYYKLYAPQNDKTVLSRDIESIYNDLNSITQKTPFQESSLKKIKNLREEIKSNNFSTYKFCIILFIAFLASYVALFVTTHTKVKELLFISALVKTGNTTTLKSHIKGSIKAGNSKETVTAAIIQCLPYVGFPNTLAALRTLKEILNEN